jgi:fatty acid desaturase
MPARDLTDPELLRHVNLLRQTDNLTNWYYLAREYLFLAAVIGATIAFYYFVRANGYSVLWAVPVTVVTILCVGAGQHRLATLTHEAAHYMLFKNRLLNEFVSEWFCMFPILATTHSYRVQHLGHHQYPNDPERDPDWTQMRLSGHRYQFPMTRGRFLWHCFFKQLLWPPALIRYVLVRARFKVHQGRQTPYRMIRFSRPALVLASGLYVLALLGALVWLTWQDNSFGLAAASAALWLGMLAFYLLAPARWFAEFAIKSDIPVRAQVCLRLTYYTWLWTALALATVLSGMPWWLFYFILWLVPLGTSFALFMIMRQIVQHGGADRKRFTNTRVFLVNPLISMAVFPIGNDYHLPHHLFPMVPHYNLRKLHVLLMETEPYRHEATVVKGYFLPYETPPQHPTVVDLLTH